METDSFVKYSGYAIGAKVWVAKARINVRLEALKEKEEEA